MITVHVTIAFVLSIFFLSLVLMGYAAYQVLKSEAKAQVSYLEDEDFWMWAAIKMSGHDLLTFLKQRVNMVFREQGYYYEVNCVKPQHPITDSVVFPITMESQYNVTVPAEKLEEAERSLGIKPQEALRYLAERHSHLDR